MRLSAALLAIACLSGLPAACGGEGEADREQAEPTPARRASTTPARVAPAELETLDPHGIAVGPDGSMFVADTAGSRVLRVGSNGEVTNFAGEPGVYGFEGDGGPAADAQLHGPTGLAVDADGSLYIVDHGNNRVRKVDGDGTIRTVAGSGAVGTTAGSHSGDGGPATKATLQEPIGIAVDATGRMFIADRDNYRVRAVDTDGTITTLAGNGLVGPKGHAGRATNAALGVPVGVATGRDGSVYFSDEEAHRIYEVGVDGVMTTVAGTGRPGYSGDGGRATRARLNGPYLLADDDRGNLYIADVENHVIRVVDRNGDIRTVAGTGTAGSRGDGGLASRARLDGPYGVAIDESGAIYITDNGNAKVRRVDPSGKITTLVP